ncbi:MAG: CehA/McbA family metallohydrolase [Gemmatimonadales bacterium]
MGACTAPAASGAWPPSPAPRELRYEETTWKARPDWSPDGKRVVYSSYLGRQWHQLWLMTPDGGDPVPLTYGEFDATQARWSRDGMRIAFVSNEGGNPSLWVLEVPGGKRTHLVPRARRYKHPTARLRIVVTDREGHRPLAARVTVTGPDGRAYAPDDAWRHADLAFDRARRAATYEYFHVDAAASVVVPTGLVRVSVSRGPEYRPAERELTLSPGTSDTVHLSLARLANLPSQGWWSGDLHVHMNYGGTYRNTPERLVFQARAEDLHVVENLIVNKEQRIPDIGYFRAGRDPASTPEYQLFHAQEFHTGFWDHTGLLTLRDHYLLPDYGGYANTALGSLYPPNAVVADLAHAQGGLLGYVHPFDSRPDPDDTTQTLSSELPVDVALGKVDYLEVMGFSNHLITSDIWYRLLNCGFRVPAGAGTDAFPNYAMLRGPAGLVRVYVRSGPVLDHDRFLAGLKAGRTFVTNAPLLSFTVAGRGPGEEVRLAGPGRLSVHVRLRSIVPVDRLEIVGNGSVVASIPLGGDGTAADTTVLLPAERSGWLVLRAYGDSAREPVLDLYPFATTSPVYVTVGGKPARSRADALYFVQWVDRVIQATRAHRGWNTAVERDSVVKLLERARGVYVTRAAEAPP